MRTGLTSVTYEHITKSYRVLHNMVDNRHDMLKVGFKNVDPVQLFKLNGTIYKHAKTWFESLSYNEKIPKLKEYVTIILNSMNMDIFQGYSTVEIGILDPQTKRIYLDIYDTDNESINWKEVFSQYHVNLSKVGTKNIHMQLIPKML